MIIRRRYISRAEKFIDTGLVKVFTGIRRSVRLKWGKISCADGYQIQYSTTSNFKKGTYAFTVLSGGSKTTASLGAKQRIKGGKTYYVRVRSFSNKFGTRCYSAWSKTKSVRVRK